MKDILQEHQNLRTNIKYTRNYLGIFYLYFIL